MQRLRKTVAACCVVLACAGWISAFASGLTTADINLLQRNDVELKQHVTCVVFVSTQCAGPCMRLMESLVKMRDLLNAPAQNVQYVSIIVDLEKVSDRDLGLYAKKYQIDKNSAWTLVQLQEAKELELEKHLEMGLKGRGEPPFMNSFVYVVDKQCRPRFALPCFTESDRDGIRKAVRALAAEN